MLILYRLLLQLYPGRLRSAFSTEMISVFRDAKADVWKQSVRRRAAFCFREFHGLIRDAWRAQTQLSNACPEPWLWSFETPLVALLLFSLGVCFAQELGIWGFFFPGTYLIVAPLMGIGAWMVGRECTLMRWRRSWKQTLTVALVCTIGIPVAAKITKEGWTRLSLLRGDTLEYRLPGIDVSIHQGEIMERQPGLTFSRTVNGSKGGVITMLHHTDAHTPPYLFFTGVLAMALALWSRRTAPTVAERPVL
jgi:hypothetical protein